MRAEGEGEGEGEKKGGFSVIGGFDDQMTYFSAFFIS